MRYDSQEFSIELELHVFYAKFLNSNGFAKCIVVCKQLSMKVGTPYI